MTTHRDFRSLSGICVSLTLLVVACTADTEECDATKCPGPLAYYEGLGCVPIYENKGDCCATKYNCDHLMARSKDKCYINGHEYNIGDALKEEDANPCDLGCICRMNYNGIAAFSCAVVDCFHGPAQPGCYRQDSPSQCCSGPDVCPEKPEMRPTCVVDGKTYMDGEHFEVASDPDLNCVCQAGYQGENVEPFCKKPNHPYCSPEFRNAGNIYNHCAPVFYHNQSPQTDCNLSSRCQNKNDTVIHNHGTSKSHSDEVDESEGSMCLFGNMKMHLGDELNQATDYESVCVKCLCEVPPVPTCQRLSDDECDVTVHPPFGN